MTRPRKIPAQAGFEPGIFRSLGGRLNHSANEAVHSERVEMELRTGAENWKLYSFKREMILTLYNIPRERS